MMKKIGAYASASADFSLFTAAEAEPRSCGQAAPICRFRLIPRWTTEFPALRLAPRKLPDRMRPEFITELAAEKGRCNKPGGFP